MLDDTKKCPYCAETIKAKAIVCRFCGRELPDPSKSPEKQNGIGITDLVVAATLLILLWAICVIALPWLKLPSSSNNNSSPNTIYAKDFVETTKDDWGCSHDSSGIMLFEGKVKNTSSTYDLQLVKLRATILSESSEIINASTAYIDSDVLYANSSSTFKIYVDDPSNKGKRCQIEVEGASFK